MVLDVGENKATSMILNRYFELSYQHVASCLPSGITFSKDHFIRSHRPNKVWRDIASHLSTTITKPIVITSVENGVVLKLTQNEEIKFI